jgi:uncharacterized RDD family membrane protein YckC
VEYEDRITVPTPEGVQLELTLAGVGSRFISALIDFLIEGTLIVALAVALFNFLPTPVATVGISLGSFALIWGYHVLFEVRASGRSPGKRAAGLRVVRAGGIPVRLRESAVRNIVRLVDLLPPVTYGVGAVSILVTRRNQRLGDLAAGTLVVRVRRAADAEAPAVPPLRPPGPDLERWDVSGVTDRDLVAVRRFLERRPTLEPAARARLATDLAARLRPHVAGAEAGEADEPFLEGLAAAKAARG